ncbi:hypothetical protein ACK8GG_00010 [Micromonosporaceae bacterium DT55]|uniref:hypothetical protein n=1 Tax=Melissospora conviva TaxID=3388432 RepID=UPI003C24923B
MRVDTLVEQRAGFPARDGNLDIPYGLITVIEDPDVDLASTCGRLLREILTRFEGRGGVQPRVDQASLSAFIIPPLFISPLIGLADLPSFAQQDPQGAAEGKTCGDPAYE